MTHASARHRSAMFGGVLLTAALAAGAAFAHHGWSSYDSSKELTLSGTVVEAKFDNPHGELRLQVSDKVWLVILAPPSRMRNRGLQQSMLPSGAKATVVGHPSKEQADEMRAERITVDGKTVELR